MRKNPNINFYVIDEEKISTSPQLMKFSLFNNHKNCLCKNIRRFHTDFGPQFFTAYFNEGLINMITEYMDDIKISIPLQTIPLRPARLYGQVRRNGISYAFLSELNSFCM